MTPTQAQLAKAQRQSEKSKLRDAFLLQLRAHKVPMPVEEYRFHVTRRWRLDDAWPAHKLAIEYHGGIWTNGRHVRGAGFEADREKVNEAIMEGWRIIEVTPKHISTLKALKWIMRALPDYVPDVEFSRRGKRKRETKSTPGPVDTRPGV